MNSSADELAQFALRLQTTKRLSSFSLFLFNKQKSSSSVQRLWRVGHHGKERNQSVHFPTRTQKLHSEITGNIVAWICWSKHIKTQVCIWINKMVTNHFVTKLYRNNTFSVFLSLFFLSPKFYSLLFCAKQIFSYSVSHWCWISIIQHK